MGIEDQLLQMKRKLDSLAQKRDRVQWEVEQLEKELKDKFGLKTPAEARKEADKARTKAEALRKEAEDKLAELQSKHGKLLEMA